MAYAPYDWLQAYDAASQNIYGEEASKQMINRIINDVGPDYQKALDAGIVVGQGGPVNWSKAPANIAGGNLPGNTMTNSVGGRYGFGNPWTGKPTTSLTGNYINDPNYGMQALVQKRAPNSPEMNIMKALAFSLAGGTAAAGIAPLIAGSLGTSGSMSQLLAKLLIGSGSTLVQGGKINPGALAGSAAGGYYGGSMGSTLGGMLGGML